MSKLCAVVLVLAACAGARPRATTTPSLDAWLGRSIYFVMIDRFADGDPSNDDADGFASNRADPEAWHGGDLRGLIDHLDYIAGMGFTALWVTPVVQQHSARAYHGYWGWDFGRIDGHLGDVSTLRALVDAAHARGMLVMLDTVANHTGRYGHHAASFPDEAMYHHAGDITDWNDRVQLETHDLQGLDDLDQANPVVRRALLDHLRWLLHASGADALRVDTAKHVPIGFWRDFAAAAHVFTMAEVLDGDAHRVAPYSHALFATLDYPLYYELNDVFALGHPATRLGGAFALDGLYRDARLGGVFIDNHDQRRFLCAAIGSVDEKMRRLELALTFAFTVRGLPIVYYGTEQGMGNCTLNRADMPTFDTRAPIYRYIVRLQHARNAALRTGDQHERWRDDTAYAFEREAGDSAAVVAFNLGSSARTLRLAELRAPPGTELHDATGDAASITVAADHSAVLELSPMSAVILTTTR